MGFLRQLFSGIDDLARNDMAGLDDLGRFDGHGFEDRAEGNLFTFNENDAVSTIGMPILDYFTYGLGSTAVKSKYNQKKYGHSGFDAGNFGKSWLANYVANQLLPGTGEYGTLSDVAANTAAGAGRGAISAGAQGESMAEGAKAGGTQAALVSGGNYLGSTASTSGTAPAANTSAGFLQRYGGQEQISSPAPYTDSGASSQYNMFTGTEQSRAPAVVEKGSPYSASYTASPQADTSSGVSLDRLGTFLKGLMPQNTERFGDQMSNLAGMYSGWRRYRDAKRMRSQYGANRDAYATQLQNKLTAQDAQRGRRSNIAGRTTQLQAALAELDSRAMPGMNQLREAQWSGLDNMLRSVYGLGNSMGYWGRQPTPPQIKPVRITQVPGLSMEGMPTPMQVPDFTPSLDSMYRRSPVGH